MIDHRFQHALEANSLEEMQSIPKTDLHSHAGRGGSIAYLSKVLGRQILPPHKPFDSLDEMNAWLRLNVRCYFPDGNGYCTRVEAAFVQASIDCIQVLALSSAVDEIDYLGGMDKFMFFYRSLNQTMAPHTRFLPDLALGYDKTEVERLDEVLEANWFTGIDICNYRNVYTLSELKEVCHKAKTKGLILKAHIGEFGGADEVWRYAEELELDQIQHGIAAAENPQLMRWLSNHHVQLNVCPTSNVMLKNSSSYQCHQIRTLYDFGVPVTLNTDDLLIFNASVSQEYFNLYRSGLMTIEELDNIRKTGLKNLS